MLSVPISVRKCFPHFREACQCPPKSARVVGVHNAVDEISGPVASPQYDFNLRRLPEWNDITLSLTFPFLETEGDKFHTIRSEMDHENEVVSRYRYSLWECVLSLLQPGQGSSDGSPYQFDVWQTLSFDLL